MDVAAAVQELQQEWRWGAGFFWRIRQGEPDPDGARRVLAVLEAVEVPPGELIDRRLVAEVWHIPLFMEWQRERIVESGGDATVYGNLCNRIQDRIRALLDAPVPRAQEP